MKDKEKFKGFMLLIGERENREISDALLDGYWETLKPFSDEQCDKAFKKVWNNTRFFPKPEDFLEHLQGGIPHMLAWKTAFTTVKKIGPYDSVKFSDPVINLVIELMGGWPAFCMMETEEIKWKQIEFSKIYKGVCQNGKGPRHLPGVHEQTNLRTQKIGYDVPIVMIGEPVERKQLGA